MKYNNFVFIAFSVIIIIGCLFYFNRILESFNPIEEKKTGLLILSGECFREGNIGSRIRDNEHTIKTQSIASNSHVKMCNYIKKTYNVKMDIIITTSETKYKDILYNFYGKYKPKIIMNNTKDYNDVKNNIKNAILNTNYNKYNFILLSRVDMYIKPNFNTIIDPNWDKIMFLNFTCHYLLENFAYTTYLETYKYNFTNDGDPCINPSFIFIPKKYFNIIKNISIHHNAWTELKRTTQLTNNDMDFMTNDVFDSNTFNDKNPFYYFVGRKENKIKTTAFVNTFDHDLIGKSWKEIEKLITNKMITKRTFIKCKDIQRKKGVE